MKYKKLTPVLLVLILAPQLVSAAWWNPFSWFSKSNHQGVQEEVVPESLSHKTTFYAKYDNSRVRACKSTDCEVIGYYKKNDYFTFDGQTSLGNLPEWIEIKEGGYINKSVLSETPVAIQTGAQQSASQGSNRFSDADIKALNSWLAYIERELQANADLVDQINQSLIDDSSADEVLDVIELYGENLTSAKNQLIRAVEANQKDVVPPILNRIQKLDDDFDVDFELAFDASLRRARRNASDASYRRMTAEQEAINKARIDASNSYTERYNAIRKQGAENGATEAVINAQLEAAGLINQVNCHFSSVGGMTPGAGSVTCY